MVGAKACVWFVLTLGLAVAVHGDGAPASAPAPALDCTSILLNDLGGCLNFVFEGSNDTKPSKDCCSGVKKVVKDKEEVSCLCGLYDQAANYGINMSRAIALPSSCGVSTSSIGKCGNITFGAPVAAPAPANAPMPVEPLGVPASAPAPALDCTSAIINDLGHCLSFAKDGSNDTKPSKDCCSGVKKVVKDKDEVSCLCGLYDQGANYGINMSRALALPSSCGVSTSSIRKCGNITFGAPVASPVPTSAPAPALDCTSAIINDLGGCLSFAQDGSRDTNPSKGCCSGIKKVAKDKEEVSCLCGLYEQGAKYGINISRALTLPSACGVSTSSINKCGNLTFGAPVAAPAPSLSAGAVPSSTTGTSASAKNWIPSSAHFAGVVFALFFSYWLLGLF